MRQFGLTLVAIVLVTTTALPAHAATKVAKPTSVSTSVHFMLKTIPGANGCC